MFRKSFNHRGNESQRLLMESSSIAGKKKNVQWKECLSAHECVMLDEEVSNYNGVLCLCVLLIHTHCFILWIFFNGDLTFFFIDKIMVSIRAYILEWSSSHLWFCRIQTFFRWHEFIIFYFCLIILNEYEVMIVKRNLESQD